MMRLLQIAGIFSMLLIYSCSNNTKRLNKSDYGDDWPFSVQSGTVQCMDGFVVVFKTGNDTYALNDAARLSGEYKNIKEILRADANYPGKKIMMDLSQIEFEGLKQCDR